MLAAISLSSCFPVFCEIFIKHHFYRTPPDDYFWILVSSSMYNMHNLVCILPVTQQALTSLITWTFNRMINQLVSSLDCLVFIIEIKINSKIINFALENTSTSFKFSSMDKILVRISQWRKADYLMPDTEAVTQKCSVKWTRCS